MLSKKQFPICTLHRERKRARERDWGLGMDFDL